MMPLQAIVLKVSCARAFYLTADALDAFLDYDSCVEELRIAKSSEFDFKIITTEYLGAELL